MSLLPPPCELFTTNDPSFRAILVKPPGQTLIPFAPYIAKGLRSTHLGFKLSFIKQGEVDRFRVGWAIYLSGSDFIFFIYKLIS